MSKRSRSCWKNSEAEWTLHLTALAYREMRFEVSPALHGAQPACGMLNNRPSLKSL